MVPGSGEPWETVVSLRVEDSPDPLGELSRLLALHGAYELVTAGDDQLVAGDLSAASDAFRRAAELAPDQPEVRFWSALALAGAGHEEAALTELRALFAEAPVWRDVLGRLTPGIAPGAAGLLARLA